MKGGRRMRVNVAREHCQNDPCDLVVTCRLTRYYVDLVKEEGGERGDVECLNFLLTKT